MRLIESMKGKLTHLTGRGSTCLKSPAAASAFYKGEQVLEYVLLLTSTCVRTSSSLLPKSVLLYGVPGGAAVLYPCPWELACFELSVRRVYFPAVAVPADSRCRALWLGWRRADRALTRGGRNSGPGGKVR